MSDLFEETKATLVVDNLRSYKGTASTTDIRKLKSLCSGLLFNYLDRNAGESYAICPCLYGKTLDKIFDAHTCKHYSEVVIPEYENKNDSA